MHEIPFNKLQLFQVLAFSVDIGSIDLVLVVIDADNMDISEARYLTSRSSHSAFLAEVVSLRVVHKIVSRRLTSQINDLLVGLQFHLESDVVLRTSDTRLKSLRRVSSGKVERSSPSPLVKIGSHIVVLIDHLFQVIISDLLFLSQILVAWQPDFPALHKERKDLTSAY